MKNRQIRNLIVTILTFAMIISILMTPVVPVQSASRGITILKSNTVYTTLDVTGDGKKDRFKIQRPKVDGRPVYSYCSISVNGKEAIRLNGWYEVDVYAKLLSLTNGKKYLFVTGLDDGIISGFTCLLQYKNGKFVKVIDFDKIFKSHAQYWPVNNIYVQGNTIKFVIGTYSSYKGYLNGDYLMQYDYKNGQLVHVSAADRLIQYYNGTRTTTVGKACMAYTNTSRNQKAFRIPKGGKVTVDQCRISSTRVLCRIRYGNRYGWVVASEAYLDFDT